MRNKLVVFVLLAGMACIASAGNLDVQLSNHTAQIGVSQALSTQTPDSSRVGAALFYNHDNDIIGSASFHILGNLRPGFEPLKFGAGVKVYAGHLHRPDVTTAALALGGMLRMDIPQTVIPLAVVAEAHYAPPITSTGQGDGVLDVSARLEARFARHASAYVGYRYFRFELDHASHHDPATNFMVGVRLGF